MHYSPIFKGRLGKKLDNEWNGIRQKIPSVLTGRLLETELSFAILSHLQPFWSKNPNTKAIMNKKSSQLSKETRDTQHMNIF